MKTTKCIALLLAIVMTLALFAGCSNSPANDPATDAPATDAPSTAPDNSDNTDGNDIPAEGLTFPNPVEAPETITTVGPDGSPAAWYTELELTPEEWDNVMNVNLRGAYFMMQTAVRHMYENKIRGNVLNIASVAATEPFYGPYCTSKAGVVGLTRGWGKQFAPYGIVINGIGPGPVATEMNGWHEGDPMDHSRIPTGRYLTVEEVSSLAMYMLSDEATQMIGETVMIDGGYDIK